MDKYEYKVRSEEIKSLVASKQYVEAMQVADTIDWRRVKSIMMLTIVSDIYKVNRRYEDSKAVLLLAYERHPAGRTIVYSLCELSIKMEEFVQAWEYYKEFVQIAPKDTGRFILQYKLYEAQEVSIEERISVLEEFKKRDYREKWAYELAYLYHRIGLSTKCIEECDELVLWFGEGKYVLKAMELKMLHEPLNPVQQDKYDQLSGKKQATSVHKVEPDDDDEFIEPDMDVQVKTVDVSKYNTINLQKELAASMKELLADDGTEVAGKLSMEEVEQGLDEEDEEPEDNVKRTIVAPLLEETAPLPGLDKSGVEPFQQEIQEVFFEEGKTEEFPAIEETEELEEIEDALDTDMESPEETKEYTPVSENEKKIIPFEIEKILGEKEEEPEATESIDTQETVVQKKSSEQLAYEKMLAQEYDGQITLVVPEAEKLEKQITGQMNIADILAEWENTKKVNQEKRMQDVKKRVSEQTGQLFSEFDEATKTDLLAKLEAASRKEEANRRRKEAADSLSNSDTLFEDTEENTDMEDTDVDAITDAELESTEELTDAEESIAEEDMDTENVAGTEETPDTQETSNTEEASEDTDTESDTTAAEENDITEQADTDASTKVSSKQEEVDNSEKREEAADAKEQKATETETEEIEEDAAERLLSEEEEKLFDSILPSRKAKRQLIKALDAVTLAPYTGNVAITGEEGTNTLELAKNLLKDIQTTDSNFSGKVAKIEGKILNTKNPTKLIPKLENGALIIEKAGALTTETLGKIMKVLDQGTKGIIIVIEDTPKNIEKLMNRNKKAEEVFNARIDVPQLNNDALVNYAKQYALDQEFSIDELGILALYTRIADMQTSDHTVSVAEVEEIMEDAIHSATKKSLSHFTDVLFGKRYDEEDMIVLREKDFINY